MEDLEERVKVLEEQVAELQEALVILGLAEYEEPSEEGPKNYS